MFHWQVYFYIAKHQGLVHTNLLSNFWSIELDFKVYHWLDRNQIAEYLSNPFTSLLQEHYFLSLTEGKCFCWLVKISKECFHKSIQVFLHVLILFGFQLLRSNVLSHFWKRLFFVLLEEESALKFRISMKLVSDFHFRVARCLISNSIFDLLFR